MRDGGYGDVKTNLWLISIRNDAERGTLQAELEELEERVTGEEKGLSGPNARSEEGVKEK